MSSQSFAALVFGVLTLCAFISLVGAERPPRATAWAHEHGYVALQRYRHKRMIALLGWFVGWGGLIWLAVTHS